VTVGLIRRAGLVSDVVAVDPLIGSAGITTVASLVGKFAADEYLRGQVDIRPSSSPRDFDTVAER